MKILLVDDSRVALMLEQRLLDRDGMQVLTCTNGAEAVMKATAERPDLIIMDICMPRMNGLEATKHLRRRTATRDIPIILMSTHASAAQVQSYRAAGCTDFLSKPVDGRELRRAVERCRRGAVMNTHEEERWQFASNDGTVPSIRPRRASGFVTGER